MTEEPKAPTFSIWTFNAYMIGVLFCTGLLLGLVTNLPKQVRVPAFGLVAILVIVVVARIVSYLVRRGS